MSQTIPKRKANWSEIERATVVEYIVDNYNFIAEKFSETATQAKRESVWRNATEKVNSVGEAERKMEEVMKKWVDLKSQTKKKEIRRRCLSKKTGGGGEIVSLTGWEEKIVSILPDVQVEGLKGGTDVFEDNEIKEAKVIETNIGNGNILVHPENVTVEVEIENDNVQFEAESTGVTESQYLKEKISGKGQKRNRLENAQFEFFIESTKAAKIKQKLMLQQLKTSQAEEEYYIAAAKKIKVEETNEQ